MSIKKQYTIYEIKHKDPYMLNSYIGMTLDFKKRMSVHKLRAKNVETYKYPLYEHIRHFGGWDNYEMTALETIECDTRQEAECRETYWIRQCNARMNRYKRHMSDIELEKYKAEAYHKKAYAKHRAKKLEASRKYYLDNRDKILKKRKENYTYTSVQPIPVLSRIEN